MLASFSVILLISLPTAYRLSPGLCHDAFCLNARHLPWASLVAQHNGARKVLGVDSQIYKCGNWFRTIALFGDRPASLKCLAKARLSSDYNPYVVDTNSWCPGKRVVQ
jgi:hypothetical protein